jgi:hypothetical protein
MASTSYTAITWQAQVIQLQHGKHKLYSYDMASTSYTAITWQAQVIQLSSITCAGHVIAVQFVLAML